MLILELFNLASFKVDQEKEKKFPRPLICGKIIIVLALYSSLSSWKSFIVFRYIIVVRGLSPQDQ